MFIMTGDLREDARKARELKTENTQELMSEEVKYMFGYISHVSRKMVPFNDGWTLLAVCIDISIRSHLPAALSL